MPLPVWLADPNIRNGIAAIAGGCVTQAIASVQAFRQRRALPPHAPSPDAVLEELRHALEELRREVGELRARLDRLDDRTFALAHGTGEHRRVSPPADVDQLESRVSRLEEDARERTPVDGAIPEAPLDEEDTDRRRG